MVREGRGMALQWRFAVATLAMCCWWLLSAEMCSAASFYASAGYRPALQNIGRFAMSMDGHVADVFVPGLKMCCGPLAARDVDGRVMEQMQSAGAASATYSSDYMGVFGALGVVGGGFRFEFRVARNFFDAIRTGGDVFTDHRDVLLVQEARPLADNARATNVLGADQQPPAVAAPVTNRLVAIRNRGIGSTAVMINACYDADRQFVGAPLVPHFCAGSGIEAVHLFGMTRAGFSVEAGAGLHYQLSESVQLVTSAFVHKVLYSTFNSVPVVYQWRAPGAHTTSNDGSKSGSSRRGVDLKVSSMGISYLGAEVGLRWLF
ncbi:outer membrane protein 13 [Anaplasma centrale str. Israel]|uniref:Outer membrane protein 13 n=2 Tax=Anaplasma centrale TaxID=769 RepID=D1ATF9_ANACI|nr:outer membrane protein 13 [Anaplasma centrale str. Israel]